MKRPPLALCTLLATTSSNPAADYSAVLPALEEDIRREMNGWNISGVAVALADDSSGLVNDLAIVRELRRYTQAIFRVDANTAWSAEQTLAFAPELKRLGVELIEL